MAPPHIEARDRPDWLIIHPLQQSRACVQPWQAPPWRELAPTDRDRAVEGEQTGRRSVLHDFPKGRPVLLSRSLVISATNAPIHAPAAIAGTLLAEQILKRRPQIRRQRANRKLHAERLAHRGLQERRLPPRGKVLQVIQARTPHFT